MKKLVVINLFNSFRHYKSPPFHTVIRIHLISLSYYILVFLPSHFIFMEQMLMIMLFFMQRSHQSFSIRSITVYWRGAFVVFIMPCATFHTCHRPSFSSQKDALLNIPAPGIIMSTHTCHTVTELLRTCSKVNNEIRKEDRITDPVKDNPVRAEVVVEERYRYR